jgi:hypothetical protein
MLLPFRACNQGTGILQYFILAVLSALYFKQVQRLGLPEAGLLGTTDTINTNGFSGTTFQPDKSQA